MDEWHYAPAHDLEQSLLERLRRFPREPDMLQYGLRSLIALAVRAWLKTYHRLEIVGRENLPAEGSYLVVANHSSHLDALCLLAALPLAKRHRAFPAAAADYFFVSLPGSALAVLAVNALPFQRQLDVRHSLDLCRQLLANPGNILILFPEGTRSTTGQIASFKPGIGALLAGTSVPAVPCYLDGAGKALPKGAWLPRPTKIRLTIGQPRAYPLVEKNREGIHALCQDLEEAVRGLSSGTERPERYKMRQNATVQKAFDPP